MRLRGAGAGFDVRRVGQAAVVLCLVALAVSPSSIVFVAGLHKNSQISALRSPASTSP